MILYDPGYLFLREHVENFGQAVIEVPDTTLQLTIQPIPRPLGEGKGFDPFWKGGLFIFGYFFATGFGFFGVPGSLHQLFLCFSAFSASLLSLLLCFSCFSCFSAFPFLCFSAFPASLPFCFSCFSAFPASLLSCFSATMLLCLSSYTILLFLFFTHVSFPTCQVRAVRFYVSCRSSSPSPSPPPDLNYDDHSRVFAAGPQPRPVFAAGPQPRPSTPSVRCRTSTTTVHAQCWLPDLNHDQPRPVFAAGPQPRPPTPSVRCRTSTTTSHGPVFAAGPQPRPSTPSVRCRTSTAGENAKRCAR